MVDVVAALLWKEGRFLICQRPAHKTRALLWEFVGGKVEPGESKEAALVRECKEELGILIQVGPIFKTALHTYPDMEIRLTLFEATIQEGEPMLFEHEQMRWIWPEEIHQFSFCPADVDILTHIQAQFGLQKGRKGRQK